MSDNFFLTVGIILSVLGLLSIISGILSKIRCNVPVEGIISNLKDKTYYHRGITTHDITPTVKYVYNGKTYESKAATSTSNTKKYHVGAPVRILVDPKCPESFVLGKPVFPYIFGIVLLMPGLLLIVCYFL